MNETIHQQEKPENREKPHSIVRMEIPDPGHEPQEIFIDFVESNPGTKSEAKSEPYCSEEKK
jgi:hypothetical protein